MQVNEQVTLDNLGHDAAVATEYDPDQMRIPFPEAKPEQTTTKLVMSK